MLEINLDAQEKQNEISAQDDIIINLKNKLKVGEKFAFIVAPIVPALEGSEGYTFSKALSFLKIPKVRESKDGKLYDAWVYSKASFKTQTNNLSCYITEIITRKRRNGNDRDLDLLSRLKKINNENSTSTYLNTWNTYIPIVKVYLDPSDDVMRAKSVDNKIYLLQSTPNMDDKITQFLKGHEKRRKHFANTEKNIILCFERGKKKGSDNFIPIFHGGDSASMVEFPKNLLSNGEVDLDQHPLAKFVSEKVSSDTFVKEAFRAYFTGTTMDNSIPQRFSLVEGKEIVSWFTLGADFKSNQTSSSVPQNAIQKEEEQTEEEFWGTSQDDKDLEALNALDNNSEEIDEDLGF